MKAEFTAIIEAASEGGYWAICPEISGANGQGDTIEETKDNLRQAIEMILEDRTADILRGLPKEAIQDKVAIGWSDWIWNENWESPVAIWNEKAVHILWINPKNGITEAVPRHMEIKEPLAKKILKSLGAEWYF